MCLAQTVVAQTRPRAEPAPRAAPVDVQTLGVVDWLQRMHMASRRHNYVGTFVVSSAMGTLSSARIWHVCEGDQQMERIEALSGPPRTTFRRNDEVITFLPQSRIARRERREDLALFPNLSGAPDSSLAGLYGARMVGKERVAGFDADVVQLQPKDSQRFGYRIWSEQRSGLVVKLQTLDGEGRVLEQSAFSELQLDAPVKMKSLARMMGKVAGYKVETSALQRTTPEAEGWSLRQPVAGFEPVSCYRRAMGASAVGTMTLQWTFSDGLASVSLFLEPLDAQRPVQEGVLSLGATSTLTRRLPDPDGDWWLTAVGEVPAPTLEAFAQSLTRLP